MPKSAGFYALIYAWNCNSFYGFLFGLIYITCMTVCFFERNIQCNLRDWQPWLSVFWEKHSVWNFKRLAAVVFAIGNICRRSRAVIVGWGSVYRIRGRILLPLSAIGIVSVPGPLEGVDSFDVLLHLNDSVFERILDFSTVLLVLYFIKSDVLRPRSTCRHVDPFKLLGSC